MYELGSSHTDKNIFAVSIQSNARKSEWQSSKNKIFVVYTRHIHNKQYRILKQCEKCYMHSL